MGYHHGEGLRSASETAFQSGDVEGGVGLLQLSRWLRAHTLQIVLCTVIHRGNLGTPVAEGSVVGLGVASLQRDVLFSPLRESATPVRGGGGCYVSEFSLACAKSPLRALAHSAYGNVVVVVKNAAPAADSTSNHHHHQQQQQQQQHQPGNLDAGGVGKKLRGAKGISGEAFREASAEAAADALFRTSLSKG